MSYIVKEILNKVFNQGIDRNIDKYSKLINEACKTGRVTPSSEEELAFAEQLWEGEILSRTTLGNNQKVYQATVLGKFIGEKLSTETPVTLD